MADNFTEAAPLISSPFAAVPVIDPLELLIGAIMSPDAPRFAVVSWVPLVGTPFAVKILFATYSSLHA